MLLETWSFIIVGQVSRSAVSLVSRSLCVAVMCEKLKLISGPILSIILSFLLWSLAATVVQNLGFVFKQVFIFREFCQCFLFIIFQGILCQNMVILNLN